MHPAPSVILFTTLSGAGFGFLFFLGLGLPAVSGLAAFLAYLLAYGLAVAGLLASTFHLGNPQRALRAFTQWRTSWLSREGWASVAALLVSAPVALAAILSGGEPPSGGVQVLGLLAAVLSLVTILSTSMIYAQLRTVPRWNDWTTPLSFFAFALTGGAILAVPGPMAGLGCLILGAVMILTFRRGDGAFAARGASLGEATGLGPTTRVLAPAQTGATYVTREMIHVVGRKHAAKLRRIAVLLGAALPAILMALIPPSPAAAIIAFAPYLIGAFVQRWLFFAEAEHVVSHYYGRTAFAA